MNIHKNIRRLAVKSSLIASIFSTSVFADDLKQMEEKYAHCMTLAEKSPDQGIAYALAWQADHAGVPARHCEAVGLFHLKEYGEAAIRLEGLVEDMRTGRNMPRDNGKPVVANARMLADMYGQAANAWLLADELIRAETAIDFALSLVSAIQTRWWSHI